MHELAESLLLSRSGATRLVEKLERDGLVTRTIDEDDRRGIQVSFTPHGTKTIREALTVHRRSRPPRNRRDATTGIPIMSRRDRLKAAIVRSRFEVSWSRVAA